MREAFEFGPYRLDAAERRLTRGSQAVALTPKAFDLLVHLVRHPGELLKKEALLEHLWPGVFVEEVNLAQNVSALRRALGGDRRDAFIQTVAGSGYRFVAAVRPVGGEDGEVSARKRLIVLPFRMLKADADLDFLSFSLPDALTAELSAFGSLVVRSSLIAARFGGEAPDLHRIREEAQVDFVVSGTVLRAGEEVRVSAQLSDAAAGTLIWSHTEQAPVGDLFRLQDSLVARIAGSLARPLRADDGRASRLDVPASAPAYHLFLKANEAARRVHAVTPEGAAEARDLYLASLREDPNYAPAWARLARVYRVLGKYHPGAAAANLGRADDCIQRALAINPDLAVAHNWAAQIDVDRGHAAEAMIRLLGLLRRQGPHAETYAGLVQACRFAGLLDASAAAHQRAKRLDDAADTGVMHTYFLQRRYPEAIAASGLRQGYVWALSMAETGKADEAVERLTGKTGLLGAAAALLAGDNARALALTRDLVPALADPEATYYTARTFAYLGDRAAALDLLQSAVRGGYACADALETDPWIEPLRRSDAYTAIKRSAADMQARARRMFEEGQGKDLLE